MSTIEPTPMVLLPFLKKAMGAHRITASAKARPEPFRIHLVSLFVHTFPTVFHSFFTHLPIPYTPTPPRSVSATTAGNRLRRGGRGRGRKHRRVHRPHQGAFSLTPLPHPSPSSLSLAPLPRLSPSPTLRPYQSAACASVCLRVLTADCHPGNVACRFSYYSGFVASISRVL